MASNVTVETISIAPSQLRSWMEKVGAFGTDGGGRICENFERGKSDEVKDKINKTDSGFEYIKKESGKRRGRTALRRCC